MHSTVLLISLISYLLLLFGISWFSSRKADNKSFFQGNKKSPWPIVAYGMLGTSVSGVTFVSVPGNVLNTNFYYMPLVFGFLAGYLVITTILLPLYYKMNLVSIYGYLENRLGHRSYKTGTVFFMISRILGATVRVFLVVLVLYNLIPKNANIPFVVVASVFMLLIFLYTYRGGVKTIIWTDCLQTTFTLLAVVLAVIAICNQMGWSFSDMTVAVTNSDYSKWIDTDWSKGTHFFKQFFSGMFITIAAVGLDQSMMQKNISCSNLKKAQKNMLTTSFILVVANFLFVWLGAVLVIYMQAKGIVIPDSDNIFGVIANEYLGTAVALFFVIGLISSSFPSAAGALTALTTSFCIDFLNFNKRTDLNDNKQTKIRRIVHLSYSVLFVFLILFFFFSKSEAVIDLVYKMVAYTYGPLLGLFFFGILTKRVVVDRVIPYVAAISPVLCWIMNTITTTYFNFGFGFTLLIFNGLFTFIGMYIFSRRPVVNL
ncbi:MAG: sodium:solute symporter [Rikenellaceae bacterium]